MAADKRRINRAPGWIEWRIRAVEKTTYQQVLTVARGGIEPPTFRFSGGKNSR